MFYRVDTLSAIFLIFFGTGLITSIGSLLLGAHGDAGSHGGSFHGATHLGGINHGAEHLGGISHGAEHLGGISHGAAHLGGISHGAAHTGDISQGSWHSGETTQSNLHFHSGEHVSFLNLNTLLGFLLGFGATGFVVKQAMIGLSLFLNLLIALLGGAAFAYILYLVLVKVLVRGQTEYLKASDFNLVGVEGLVSSTIFANRVGEVSYVLNRSLAAIPAKEKDGREIKKGEQVIIVEVRDGTAVVLPKGEFMHYSK